ncbi:MAG: D-alanyl-D-alanine carboxypeptidase/D-alanyl-D-alanine-endopeptidase [Planctomycetes bacterium]|nr:D-alanyl-D-alanine carboxypeptidase/D-alanyl-D-alanine-endopeptidase [Planctomycetota bacterium]
MKAVLSSTIAVFLVGAVVRAQAGDPVAVRDRVHEALDALLAAKPLAGARVGVVVLEPKTGEVLAESRPDEGFLTASNMKLISSAVALEVLGPDYVFETKLVGRGTWYRNGTFDGDLVLVGSGDPTLGATYFEKSGSTAPFVRMAAALETRGVRKIEGRVLGDDSCQPDEVMGLGWDWSYHADWYAAQVGGLCFNENCIDVIFEGTAAGRPPLVRLEPETGFVTIQNRVQCLTPSKGVRPSGVTWARTLGGNEITLTGSLAVDTRGKRDWGSVHNPTAFAATVLRETLVRQGIPVTGAAGDTDEVAEPPQGEEMEMYVHRSPPLRRIVHALNKRSQNLYAEQLPRAAARARGGDGSMASARKVARQELERLGVDTSRLVLADGSGLSRLDMVSPRQIATLLDGMRSSPHFEIYFDSLPVAGVDGTLRRRFPEGNAARGRVHAKTGYVSRTVALSGYVPRNDCEPLVFSILINDFLGASSGVQAAVDAFVGKLCTALP